MAGPAARWQTLSGSVVAPGLSTAPVKLTQTRGRHSLLGRQAVLLLSVLGHPARQPLLISVPHPITGHMGH